MRSLNLFLVFSFMALMCCSSTEIPVWDEPVNFLTGRWLAQKADRVEFPGEILSSAEYRPEGWLDAVVPGTVLSTPLHNEVIPDPPGYAARDHQGNQAPAFFIRRFPPFNSEIGSVGVPVYETMQRILTGEELLEFS